MSRSFTCSVYWRNPVRSVVVGEQAAVVAHAGRAEGQERLALRERVEVEHHLLRRLQASPPCGSRSGTACPSRCASSRRSRRAGRGPSGRLLDAREHLLVERVLEAPRSASSPRRCRRSRRSGTPPPRGPRLVPQPEVVVVADVAVDDVDFRHALGQRGGWRGGTRHAPNRTHRGGACAAGGSVSTLAAPCPSCPTSRSTSRRSTRASAGARLERVRLASPFVLRSVDPPLAEAAGRAVTGLRRLGKRIVIELEGDLLRRAST